MKKTFSALLTIAILLGMISFFFYTKALDTANTSDSEKISFNIQEGETVDSILQNLVSDGLLRKSFVTFTKIYLKTTDNAAKIQAGNYSIPKNLSIKELITTLQDGKEQDIWVTIPEGLRKDEIAKIISTELSKIETSSFSSEEFLTLTTDEEFIGTLELTPPVKDLEGFLFPDKYALAPNSTTKSVIEVLVNNFKKKVKTEYSYDDIVMASIVEREGYTAQDRPIIAGILLKRLSEGWLLQADATLLYPVKDWKHDITVQDKGNDNPYNTYKKNGLPPTPICNPGIQAIDATRNPESSSYYFYIHDKDGVPHYGATLDEHNANVTKYLR